MSIGLSNNEKNILINILKKYLTTGLVILYGSRANGKYSPRSDVDLTLKNSNLSNTKLDDLKDEIDESNFPYLCDISLFENIQNNKLKEHIKNFGKVLEI